MPINMSDNSFLVFLSCNEGLLVHAEMTGVCMLVFALHLLPSFVNLIFLCPITN